MRLSTIAFSFIALGVAAVSASSSEQITDVQPVARDYERKLLVRDPRKRKHSSTRSAKLFTGGTLTWYGGGQLDAPACGGPTPKSTDLVIAVKEGGPFKCGDTVHIHHGGKKVKVTVADFCAGCDDLHLDLTQGAFKQLATLDVGEIHGAHIKLIPGGD